MGGRYFLTGHDFLSRTTQNNFEVQDAPTLEFFELISGQKPIYLPVSPALRIYVHYPMAEKRNLQTCFA